MIYKQIKVPNSVINTLSQKISVSGIVSGIVPDKIVDYNWAKKNIKQNSAYFGLELKFFVSKY
ncbi:MAG: hypothetical protein JWN56_2366 [Sphingobacteriales bacterium]|nr:hypothetical protein [Sphingobacteriales bacterium]